jgi:hypothetical protein
MNIIFTLLLHIEVLKLPDSLLLGFSDFRETFSDDNEVWHMISFVVIIFKIL